MSRTVAHAHAAYCSSYRVWLLPELVARKNYRRGITTPLTLDLDPKDAMPDLHESTAEADLADVNFEADFYERFDRDDFYDEPYDDYEPVLPDPALVALFARPRRIVSSDPVRNAKVVADALRDKIANRYDMDFDAECGWAAPTSLVWSDIEDNTTFTYEEMLG